MEAPTTNLGLPQFEDTDDLHFGDVNDAFDKIDLLTVPTVCTAATRPATQLFVGRTIWQTDTEEFYKWTGTKWLPVKNLISTPAISLPANYTKSNDLLLKEALSDTQIRINLRVMLQRTGSSQVLSTSGHTVIGTIVPVGSRINQDLRFPVLLDIGAGSVGASGFLSAAGELRVKAFAAATLAVGDSIFVQTAYSGTAA